MADHIAEHGHRLSNRHIYEADVWKISHVLSAGNSTRILLNVLTIVDRNTGAVMQEIIKHENQVTLIKAISAIIPAHSVIMTDSHPGFAALHKVGYKHYTCNHSQKDYSHLDPELGENIPVHVNTCEGHHKHLRSFVMNKSLRKEKFIFLLVKEYEYRHSGLSLLDPFRSTE